MPDFAAAMRDLQSKARLFREARASTEDDEGAFMALQRREASEQSVGGWPEFQAGLPDGFFSNKKIPIWVNFRG
jgi:hypothetical protein